MNENFRLFFNEADEVVAIEELEGGFWKTLVSLDDEVIFMDDELAFEKKEVQ